MKNINIYNKRMKNTVSDKMWFVSLVPKDIDTIIDFGCADGSLALALSETFPGRFNTYIGIDNNKDMRRLCKANIRKCKGVKSFYLYNSFQEFIDNSHINYKTSVFIMNSVIHELYYYCNSKSGYVCDEFDYIIQSINKLGIDFVAIRDMFCNINKINSYPLFENICISSEAVTFAEYLNYFDTAIKQKYPELNSELLDSYAVADFLMKWFYKENWDREMKEFYFWNWIETLKTNDNYKITHSDFFQVPYIVDKAKELEVSITWNTHAKILLAKRKM